MWARFRQVSKLAIILVGSFAAQALAEDKIPLSAEQRSTLEGSALRGVGAKMLEIAAIDDAYRILPWIIEVPHPQATAQLDIVLPNWLSERGKSLAGLSRCLKQECLPVDAWREARQTALLLHILNNFKNPAVAAFAEQSSELVKGLLGQVLHGERDFKLPIIIRIEIISALLERLIDTSDEGILKVVLVEAGEVVPLIARTERGKSLRSESEERETLTQQLAALKLYMQIYESTADKAWLMRAKQLGTIIGSSLVKPEVPAWRSALADQYAAAPPVLMLLFHYTGSDEFQSAAQAIDRAALGFAAELTSGQAALVLEGISRINSTPLHITVVGGKADLEAIKLFSSARRIKAPYKRLEWWDQLEGAMLNPDVRFPSLKKPAAFVCAERRCSMPIFNPADIEHKIHEFTPAK